MKKWLLSLLIVSAVFSGCKDEDANDDPTPQQEEKEFVVSMQTDFGEMLIWLYKGTPLHRENFLKLASEGFYDSTEFHRIIQNFMIQGGDPLSKDENRNNDGTGGPGYRIPAEIDTTRYKHKLGAIAAARTNNPEKESSGCQFYIVVSEPGTKHLNGNYTVFGELIKGIDVAWTIVAQPSNSRNLPNERIRMQVDVMEMTPSKLKSDYNFDIPE